MLVYLNITKKRIWRSKICSENTSAWRICFEIRKNTTLITSKWSGGQITSTEQFVCWKSPLGIPNQRWSRGHKARGQGQGHKKSEAKDSPSRTDSLEAKAKDGGHKRKCSPKKSQKKKKSLQNFFSSVLQKKKGLQQKFSDDVQHFNDSKNNAAFEPRTGQFSKTWGFEAKNFKMHPRGLKRPPLSQITNYWIIKMLP